MSQLRNLDRRPREVGQLKLGRMAVSQQSGKSYPSKLDHFEILKRGPKGEWERDTTLHQAIGETPRSIRVTFFSNEIDEVFHSELALYRAKSRPRYCSGDQVEATLTLFEGDVIRFEDGKLDTQRLVQNQFVSEGIRPICGSVEAFEAVLDMMPELERKESGQGSTYWQCVTKRAYIKGIGCESAGCPLSSSEDANNKCKPHAILKVNLLDAPKFGSHHVFRTSSWNSIQGILATLELVKENAGALGGIRFLLCCQQEAIQAGDRKRMLTIAHLEVDGTLSKMIEDSSDFHERRLASMNTQQALLAPVPISEELDKDFHTSELVDEFDPDIPDEPTLPEVVHADEVPDLEDMPSAQIVEPTFDEEAPSPEDESQETAPAEDVVQPQSPVDFQV